MAATGTYCVTVIIEESPDEESVVEVPEGARHWQFLIDRADMTGEDEWDEVFFQYGRQIQSSIRSNWPVKPE